MSNFNYGWNRMQFYAFDSYEGIPKPTDIDVIIPVFEEGTYTCTERDFWENLRAAEVDLAKVKVVKGFFKRG